MHAAVGTIHAHRGRRGPARRSPVQCRAMRQSDSPGSGGRGRGL